MSWKCLIWGKSNEMSDECPQLRLLSSINQSNCVILVFNHSRLQKALRMFYFSCCLSPSFFHAKTRIWPFTQRSKVTTINAPRLWWPNWYMTRSRPSLHYLVTNKCGAGPNRCWQQQPCCRSPSGKPFGCVLQANNHLQQRCQIHKQNFC